MIRADSLYSDSSMDTMKNKPDNIYTVANSIYCTDLLFFFGFLLFIKLQLDKPKCDLFQICNIKKTKLHLLIGTDKYLHEISDLYKFFNTL